MRTTAPACLHTWGAHDWSGASGVPAGWTPGEAPQNPPYAAINSRILAGFLLHSRYNTYPLRVYTLPPRYTYIQALTFGGSFVAVASYTPNWSFNGWSGLAVLPLIMYATIIRPHY